VLLRYIHVECFYIIYNAISAMYLYEPKWQRVGEKHLDGMRVVVHLKTHSTDLVERLSHPSYTWESTGSNPVVGIGVNTVLKMIFSEDFQEEDTGVTLLVPVAQLVRARCLYSKVYLVDSLPHLQRRSRGFKPRREHVE
jgi:hypothetical protein